MRIKESNIISVLLYSSCVMFIFCGCNSTFHASKYWNINDNEKPQAITKALLRNDLTIQDKCDLYNIMYWHYLSRNKTEALIWKQKEVDLLPTYINSDDAVRLAIETNNIAVGNKYFQTYAKLCNPLHNNILLYQSQIAYLEGDMDKVFDICMKVAPIDQNPWSGSLPLKYEIYRGLHNKITNLNDRRKIIIIFRDAETYPQNKIQYAIDLLESYKDNNNFAQKLNEFLAYSEKVYQDFIKRKENQIAVPESNLIGHTISKEDCLIDTDRAVVMFMRNNNYDVTLALPFIDRLFNYTISENRDVVYGSYEFLIWLYEAGEYGRVLSCGNKLLTSQKHKDKSDQIKVAMVKVYFATKQYDEAIRLCKEIKQQSNNKSWMYDVADRTLKEIREKLSIK